MGNGRGKTNQEGSPPGEKEAEVLRRTHQLQLLPDDVVLRLVDRILEQVKHSEAHATPPSGRIASPPSAVRLGRHDPKGV